ncbi:hypothetical protein CLV67_10796 [Actinoplanes italicus]|uniref:Uncharacterized protein n=1 Tax=Actinoplanes italicus TaxID=113567 RepID=A0A2T0KC41_9ACTN|nr:hypothetical protein CLV67_10796 [Actinoplanes italicus]
MTLRFRIDRHLCRRAPCGTAEVPTVSGPTAPRYLMRRPMDTARGAPDDAPLAVRPSQPTVAGSRIGAGMTTTGQVALRMQDSLTEPRTVCRTRLWP